MKKLTAILVPIILMLIFTTPLQAQNISYGPKTPGLSGKLKGPVLIFSGANNPVRARINIKAVKKRSFSIELAAFCNRKLPPDCLFSLNFLKVTNCKATAGCKKSAKAALRKIRKGKKFTVTASYLNKGSVAKKQFSCRKIKNSKISCRVKK